MDRKDTLPKLTKEDKELIKLFQSEVEKINTLYVKAINSNDISKANQLLKKIRRINDHLSQAYGERAEVRIPQEYAKGSGYIDDILGMDSENSLEAILSSTAKINSYIDELGPIHTEAVNALLDNSKNYVKSSLDGMERQALTMLNQLQQEQVRTQLAKGIISGDSSYGRNQSLREYFLENGITGFKDRGGKYRSIDRYVDMLTRTETAIANTQGTINRALELGITQFEIIESPDCCQECAEMNGDIVDIRDGVVELPPFHPNCRGYIVAILEDDEGNKTELDLREEENDDIGNDRAKTPEERMKKALDIIENSTMYLNHEQGALINMNGEIIRMASGLSGSVVLPRYGINEPYIMTHNHPNSSTFSKNDLSNWLCNDNQYGVRASSKLGTYYLYAESHGDKAKFIVNYNWFERTASVSAKNDMLSIATAWRSGTTKDYIKMKDGTMIYYKDDPLKFDQIMDEHIWKHYRELLQQTADRIPGVEFEYIPNDGKQKDTELNKMYLDKVEELNKLRRKKIKTYEDKEGIGINDYI